MRYFVIGLFLISLLSCQKKEKKQEVNLAVELKADQYGMSKYVMAFLKAGPNRTQDSLMLPARGAGHIIKRQSSHLFCKTGIYIGQGSK